MLLEEEYDIDYDFDPNDDYEKIREEEEKAEEEYLEELEFLEEMDFIEEKVFIGDNSSFDYNLGEDRTTKIKLRFMTLLIISLVVSGIYLALRYVPLII